MEMRANIIFRRKIVALSIPVLAYLFATIFQSQILGNMLSPISMFTAAGILLFSYLKTTHKNTLNLTFLLYFMACAAWGTADSIWLALETAGVEPGANPILWVVYTLTNLFLLAAIVLFTFHQFSRWNFVQLCIDAAFLGVISAYLIWIVFMDKDIAIVEALFQMDFTSIFSIFSDIIISISIFIWFLSVRSGKIPPYIKIIALGISIFAVTDLVYYFFEYRGLYVPNSLIDFSYVLSLNIVAYGGLWWVYHRKSTIDISKISNVGTRKTLRYLFVLPGIAAMVILFDISKIKLDLVDIAVFAAIVLIYKAVIRYVQLSIENEALLKKEIIDNEILELRVAEQVKELTYLANQDTLTSLYNRRYFVNYLDTCVKAMTPSETMALFLIDMDRFKIINDNYGHDTGDKILVEFANRLKYLGKYGAMQARLGGDEFGIVLIGKYVQKDFDSLCTEIIQQCCQPVLVGNNEIAISISIGIALCTNGECNTTDLMKNADIAMYQAKSHGYNKFQFFDPILSFNHLNANKIEVLLKQANIERDFELFYQPQFSLPEKQLVGAEALLRWNTSEHGYIPPNVFIPVAEKIEHISKIGKWVITESIRQALVWNHMFPNKLKVGINLSPKQIEEDGFVDMFRLLIHESGIAPAWLDTEITEGTIISDENKIQSLFEMLKKLGISSSMDDFGTGYSAIGHLNKYPFDRIKIDKSLIDNVSSFNRKGINIVASIIKMAKSIGVQTIAEGVEKQEQVDILSEIGCDQVQGYFFGRPVPASVFEDMFVKNGS